MDKLDKLDKLENCPFCGGRAYIDTFGGLHIDAFHKKNCIVQPSTFLSIHSANIKKQIKAWNRRADNDNN